MKHDVRMTAIQAERLLVGNKMHLMSTGSKFNAQLSTHHAAATVGWITRNANFHDVSFAKKHEEKAQKTLANLTRVHSRKFVAKAFGFLRVSVPPWWVLIFCCGKTFDSTPRFKIHDC
jgi:PBP1b-binding outer membrane lipoprotein LpoB